MSSRSVGEVTECIEIAERIVRAQGNLFIKELLRKKRRTESSIKIGVTKDDVLENLVAAISAKHITRDDLENWIREVEGWGRQHVYLYHVSSKLSKDVIWKSAAAVARRVRAGADVSLGAGDGKHLDFPEELKLSTINYVDGALEVVWRKSFEHWIRDRSKDKRRNVEGDLYEFRAYRQELNRAVTRFVLKPASRSAAVFVQVPLSDPKHEGARAVVTATLDPIFGWHELKPVDVSNVIKSFDQAELDATGSADPGKIVAQTTKFAADGASVLFEADPGNTQWKTNSAVRGVRRALDTADFSGHSAVFQLQLRASEGLYRDVSMSLNGRDRRVYLHAQMTAVEVWQVLDEIMRHSV